MKVECGRCDVKNIFNVDETGLSSSVVYPPLSRRTYIAPEERLRDARDERYVGEGACYDVCTNETGSAKMPMSIIGRARNPRCFPSQKVPIEYLLQTNAWLDNEPFTSWFAEVFLPFAQDHTTGSEDKLLLQTDCCRSHYALRDPEGRIEVWMLPGKSTDKHQSMDMGIIAATQLHDRCTLSISRTLRL